MLQGKAPIIYGDGEQKRCFSYIDDCIKCLIPMLDQKNLNKQIINIGPDEEFVTINKIAEICSNVTGVNLEPIYKEDRPREVKYATCSADKARKLLKYKTKTNLIEGIKETLKYLPDGAVVANAARGEIINDKDMLDAIRIGKVFALGLDVYNGVPQINEEYLKQNGFKKYL